MKAKKMSMKKDECCGGMKSECCVPMHGHRPRGKALFEIALGIIMLMFFMGFLGETLSLMIGLIGALMLLKGAVRFFESPGCH